MIIGMAVLAALIVGFLAGLLTFKRSEQWCPHHGITRVCPHCEHALPAMTPIACEGRVG